MAARFLMPTQRHTPRLRSLKAPARASSTHEPPANRPAVHNRTSTTLGYLGTMEELDPELAMDAIRHHAAYSEEEVPQCYWAQEWELRAIRVVDLPENAELSVQLADALGDLPGVNAEARLYGSKGNLKVIVTHEAPTPGDLPEYLSCAGYLQMLSKQVAVAPPGRSRLTYANADSKFPAWLAEYTIEVEGETLYDLALQGHRIAHQVESSFLDKTSHLTSVFEDLTESGHLVTIADVDRVDRAVSAHEKGVALEDLIANLFVSLGGLQLDPRHGRNLRTVNSEIDHVFYNRGVTPWAHGSPLVITECKNWSGTVERSTLDSLETKIRDRGGQCRVGVFISWAGFSEGFETQLIRASREPFLIITMDGQGIRRAVKDGNFRSYVQTRYQDAISR